MLQREKKMEKNQLTVESMECSNRVTAFNISIDTVDALHISGALDTSSPRSAVRFSYDISYSLLFDLI